MFGIVSRDNGSPRRLTRQAGLPKRASNMDGLVHQAARVGLFSAWHAGSSSLGWPAERSAMAGQIAVLRVMGRTNKHMPGCHLTARLPTTNHTIWEPGPVRALTFTRKVRCQSVATMC